MPASPSPPCKSLLVYILLLGLSIFALVQWNARHHPSSGLALLDIVQSTIQHGQPVDLPITTELYSLFENQENQSQSQPNPFVSPLTDCIGSANPRTSHRRLADRYHYLNISLIPPDSDSDDHSQYFNPTFLPLPSWAATSQGAKYVLVTRRVTEGFHQESCVCLADICLPHPSTSGTRTCTPSDHSVLGPHGGLRCITPPVRLNIPPTPALHCSGHWSHFPYLPGFHDPRIFWSNRGEPLLIVNSASQYGCLGLWLLDLRSVYTDLATVLLRDGKRKAWQAPVVRYRHLTELTRVDRAEVEKNWMIFFPGGSSSGQTDDEGDMVVQYDIAPKYDFSHVHHDQVSSATCSSRITGGRTLALLQSNTGTAMKPAQIDQSTSTSSSTCCFPPSSLIDSLGQHGNWHQSTNALKLILCTRSELRSGACGPRHEWLSSGREVHFSIIHRKFSNSLALPMRYERYAVVWEGRRPWRMIGISRWPILFAGEVAQPWTREENVIRTRHVDDNNNNNNDDDDDETATNKSTGWRGEHSQHRHRIHPQHHGQKHLTNSSTTSRHQEDKQKEDVASSAYFAYTPSIAWAWRPAADHFDADDNQTDGTGEQQDIVELERLGVGFLGDDILVGIGLDDVAQAMVSVKVDEIVGCLRFCQS